MKLTLVGCFFFLIAIPLPFQASADEVDVGFEVTCNNNKFKILGREWDSDGSTAAKEKGGIVYRGFDKKSISCGDAGDAWQANIRMPSRGYVSECGTGARITLLRGKRVVLSDVSAMDCGESLLSIEATQHSRAGYNLKLCGSSDSMKTPSFDGCVILSEANIDELRRPLGPGDSISEVLGYISPRDPVELAALNELFARDGFAEVKKIEAEVSPSCVSINIDSIEFAPSPAPHNWRKLVINRCGKEIGYFVVADTYESEGRKYPHFSVVEQLMDSDDYVRLLATRNGLHCSVPTVVTTDTNMHSYLVTCGGQKVEFGCDFKSLENYTEGSISRNKSACWLR